MLKIISLNANYGKLIIVDDAIYTTGTRSTASTLLAVCRKTGGANNHQGGGIERVARRGSGIHRGMPYGRGRGQGPAFRGFRGAPMRGNRGFYGGRGAYGRGGYYQ